MISVRNFARVLLIATSSTGYCFGQKAKEWRAADVAVKTIWADSVTPGNVYREYPRPQMVRKGNWTNLNGLWQIAFSDTSAQEPSRYTKEILVPFPVESALSGIKEKLSPNQFLWYRRKFRHSFQNTDKVLLHFGAVDYKAWVFINGKEVGMHEGGYTSFSFDISKYLVKGDNDIVVKVYDPTNIGKGPHGKQVLTPGNIYYTASSGIWQTVWVETVPENFINSYTIKSRVDVGTVECSVKSPEDGVVEVIIKDGNSVVARGRGKSNQQIRIPLVSPKLWWPDAPFLYTLSIKLIGNHKTKDSVSGYFGFREVSIAKDASGISRIFLNNKYIFNHGVLDQGFWPEGLYTAPTASAMEFDVKAIKQMGYNTIRKHIKVEPELWYYYADKLGLLVWQDMVNPNQGLPEGAKAAFEKQSVEIVHQLYNHPSIIMWVVFNERWGQFDQKRVCDMIRSNDPTRIINGHSGEYLYVDNKLRESSKEPYTGSDVTDVHSYPFPKLGMKLEGKAQVCGEYGGTGVSITGHQWDDLKGWGYIQASVRDLKLKYSAMIDSVKRLESEGLSGSIYTEPFDVEGEENGLMTYDRKVIKIHPAELWEINRKLTGEGTQSPFTSVLGSVTYDADIEAKKYEVLSRLYENGRKDSVLLRQLTLRAFRDSNWVKARQLTGEYLSIIRDPYSVGNLTFLVFVTVSVKDPGFNVFLNNTQQINATLGANYAEGMIRRWVYRSEIKPVIDAGHSDSLESMIPVISNKYGVVGAEKLYGELMMYYFGKKNWEKFGKYYSLYYQTAITRSEYHINNISWPVVEHIEDPLVLQTALVTMKYNIDKFSQDNPYDADTYAGILFKIGMKNDAIRWAEKAVKLSNNQAQFVTNRDKLRLGQKTW
ncbi:Beta-galactosidase/beta-glucuronidase [Chryseobacterium wanjuense]|uniref:Beta-galactosidase/beta-glucuronidase n=1 Tax=Chryseobacterium wanjuense TaxID=356305 RepID=A0A1I0QDH9_9FLAO|nr:sugar-binding domain-containing protein [Chryseobacterium wanjuense]SEW24881.1 Beta-galactosidase/beta-glucuronidase [Chryseobacterium wanjuense]